LYTLLDARVRDGAIEIGCSESVGLDF